MSYHIKNEYKSDTICTRAIRRNYKLDYERTKKMQRHAMFIIKRLAIKIAIFLRLVCRLKSVLIKISAICFMGTGMLGHIWKSKRPRVINVLLRNSNHTGPRLANSSPSLKAIVIKTVILAKDRPRNPQCGEFTNIINWF